MPPPLPPSVSPRSLSDLASSPLGGGGGGGRDQASEKPCPALVPRDVSLCSPGDLSYFWERSEVTFLAEGERKGEPAHSGVVGRKPGGLIFPVPEGGFFPLVACMGPAGLLKSALLTNEPHDVGVVEFPSCRQLHSGNPPAPTLCRWQLGGERKVEEAEGGLFSSSSLLPSSSSLHHMTSKYQGLY